MAGNQEIPWCAYALHSLSSRERERERVCVCVCGARAHSRTCVCLFLWELMTVHTSSSVICVTSWPIYIALFVSVVDLMSSNLVRPQVSVRRLRLKCLYQLLDQRTFPYTTWNLYLCLPLQFRSAQFKMVAMRSEKPICAPSRLSEVSPTLSLKQFQCSSDWRWPSLVLSRKVV